MRTRTIVPILAGVMLLLLTAPVSAQPGPRKLKRAAPVAYPEMARKLRLVGAVKLELQVAADGKVTKVTALGGHPILVNEAVSTVKEWQYEPGEASTEFVTLHFQP
jgi:TonB family protein